MVDLCFALGPDDFHVVPTEEEDSLRMIGQEINTYMGQKGKCYTLSQLSKGSGNLFISILFSSKYLYCSAFTET